MVNDAFSRIMYRRTADERMELVLDAREEAFLPRLPLDWYSSLPFALLEPCTYAISTQALSASTESGEQQEQ